MAQLKTVFSLFVVGMILPASQAATQTTSVTILAVSPFGEVLSPVKVTSFVAGNGRGRDYASQFAGAKAEKIPIGPYMVNVTAGGRRIANSVFVGRMDGLVVVSGPDKIIERGPGLHGVIGKVTGIDGIKPVWLRLVSVFSEDLCCTIAPVSEDGTFSFPAAEAGEYVLFVLSDKRVLVESRIRIESAEEFIDVDVAQAQANVRRP
jgi:hypothetical protein